MRSLLVDARPGPAGRARIETALTLARQFDGHVTLLVDTPVDRFIAVDGLGGSLVSAEALRDAMAEDDAFAAAIDAQLARQDVCCDVVRGEGEPVAALAAAARLADLVVVSRGEPLAADLPLATRCPVLALAPGEAAAGPFARIAVAWDGGDSAAHALRASLPLLVRADTVTVLTVQGEAEAAGYPATEVLSYLSRHGVSAELRPLVRQGSAAATLATVLAVDPPDLVVMGAYGHGRLRAALFGGVTERLLGAGAGPALLLAH
ncbi:universal stress protein [Novosphingobium piscinae]|uniref:Universal stress protein n=1 Tax=Novosphingobium piscinae TaxID=1507448 RepID=A0A7X1FZM9_9SPHN|nr:universal stress protein [Novosphingobium piscinae]MBC2669934.1 universal stress protein [Novosphingobium piscinae]